MFLEVIFQRLRDRLFEIRQYCLSYPSLKKVFLKAIGYPLNLNNPQTHNERLNHKKIFDRNPLIPITSDKVRVRDYVKKILGEEEGNQILIPLIHISKTGEDIPRFPGDFEFFMKANHASGRNLLVTQDTDPELLKRTGIDWLKSSFGQALHEWAYRDIPRRIICEKVIRTETGKIPADVKYYCFHGRPKMILFLVDRFDTQRRVFTDTDFNVLPGSQMYGMEVLSPIPVPPTHLRMMDLAARLAQPFVFCRIDFYTVGGAVFFGELTHYTGSGLEKFDDVDLDLAIGRLWLRGNIEVTPLQMLEKVKAEKRLIA